MINNSSPLPAHESYASAVEVPPEATDDSKPRALPLTLQRFSQAEYERNIWEAIPPAGTDIEDMLRPEYWQHLGTRLKVRDRIEVFAEDGKFWAELIVMSAGKLFASVAVLRHVGLDGYGPKYDSELLAGYIVEYHGPIDKWRIRRGSEVIHAGFDIEKQAHTWLESHLKTVTRGVENAQSDNRSL